jgi:hypothetical protein
VRNGGGPLSGGNFAEAYDGFWPSAATRRGLLPTRSRLTAPIPTADAIGLARAAEQLAQLPVLNR